MAKTQSSQTEIILLETDVQNQIYNIRGHRVMLDSELAALYIVETKHLKRQVRRNIERFPDDFMFELTNEEYRILRSQFGTLKQGGHSKYPPMAFTGRHYCRIGEWWDIRLGNSGENIDEK